METKNNDGLLFSNPGYSEVLSAARFLHLYMNHRDDIQAVRILPPVLGSRLIGGRILVRRKSRVYRPLFRRLVK